MFTEVFYWIVNMSITGSLIGLMLQLLRMVRKIPRFVVYILWSLVLFRLVLPFSIASPYSAMNFITKTAAKTVPFEGVTITNMTMSNYVMAAEDYFPIAYKTSLLEDIFRVSSLVWVIGLIASLLVVIYLYVATSVTIKKNLTAGEGFYQSKFSGSPFVYGIMRPKIILPPDITDLNLQYVLVHEKVHIKRLDNLWRMAALITACVHWFNPLIWYFIKMFFTDMEFACDEKAVKTYSVDERKEYASAMLKYVVKGVPFAASPFGGSVIKKRIEHVLSYKTLSLISFICVTVLACVIAVTLLTNPVK